ncbi:HEAT repeat domain-containing protein [Acanthopleuribacter pedis]|uniref:HEAT repeat domain-containing protein n=1 Tax=Acanthopleuribacter pedis TaxID=442870 RepID=A0A8J7U5B2_9BACT|nr:HEAT repeat domain-containing protein [Acanthopleuribacter pedis]MBO1320669.1 HEAT repeat domain-containing protein [Acanthopleuribacter pedis]
MELPTLLMILGSIGIAFRLGRPLLTRLRLGEPLAGHLLKGGFEKPGAEPGWHLATRQLTIHLERMGTRITVTFTDRTGGPRAKLEPAFEKVVTEVLTGPTLAMAQNLKPALTFTEDHIQLAFENTENLTSTSAKQWMHNLMALVIPAITLTTGAFSDPQRWLWLTTLRSFAAHHAAAVRALWPRFETVHRSPDDTEAADRVLAELFPGLSRAGLSRNLTDAGDNEPPIAVFRRWLDDPKLLPEALHDQRPHLRVTGPFELVTAMVSAPLPPRLLTLTLLDVPSEYNQQLLEMWRTHREIARDPEQTKVLIDFSLAPHKDLVKLLIENSPAHSRKHLWQKAWCKTFLQDEALSALSAMSDLDLIPFFKQQLREGRQEDHLIHVLANHPSQAGRDALIDCLTIPHLIARIKNHLKSRNDDLLIKQLAACMLNPSTCDEILLHFSERRDDRLLEAMLTALSRPELVERVLPHVMTRREKGVLPALIEVVTDARLPLSARITVTNGLKMFTDPAAQKTLRALIDHGEQGIALAAIEGLGFRREAGDLSLLAAARKRTKDRDIRAAIDRATARIRESNDGGETGLLSLATPSSQGDLEIAPRGGDLSKPS